VGCGDDDGASLSAADCERRAQAAAEACDSPSRQCNFTLIENGCSDARASVTVEIIDCLTAEGTCQTPFDPSGSRSCLEAAVSSGGAHLSELSQTLEGLCGAAADDLPIRVYGAIAGPDSDLTSCVAAAAQCPDLEACYTSSFAPAPASCSS